MPMKHEWPAPLSSGSLLPPRPTLPEAALALHGAQPSFALQASHSSHTTLGRIVWSVAEAVVGIPIEKWDSAKVGICVEKTRFDAFRPLNATLSAGLAFANALLTEGMRCGLDQDLIAQIAGEEPEARDEELPEFSWDMVRFNTVAGMGREVIGLTAQRSVELAAKPRLSSGAYREILTHVPKKAKHVYTQECRTCVPASKWAMGARAAGSKVVRVGAIFYLTRAATVWFGDVSARASRWKASERGGAAGEGGAARPKREGARGKGTRAPDAAASPAP